MEEKLAISTAFFMTMLSEAILDIDDDDLDFQDKLAMAQKAGQDIRKIITTYTGLDITDLVIKLTNKDFTVEWQ